MCKIHKIFYMILVSGAVAGAARRTVAHPKFLAVQKLSKNIHLLVRKFSVCKFLSKNAKFWAEKIIFKTLRGKIVVLSTHNLLCQKMAASCTANHDAAASNDIKAIHNVSTSLHFMLTRSPSWLLLQQDLYRTEVLTALHAHDLSASFLAQEFTAHYFQFLVTQDSLQPCCLHYTESQKTVKIVFLITLLIFFTNFDDFWHKNGQDDRIMQGGLIFHLT